MLKTRNIFIDTEVFVSNNFFQNKNLQRLAEFGNSETVNIYLTEITKNEIQSNIKENLMNAQQEINNFKKIISNKGKILKNLQNFKPYIDLPKLEVNINFDELSIELENFIKEGKVKFIAFELANITDVVNNYFNQKPPFSLGKKKHEFPDAIVLSAIENWCKKENEQIYVISDDADFKSYVSSEIITIPNIKIMLDKINKQYQTDETLWITKIFEINRENIIEKINEAFIEKIYDEVGFEIEITDVKIEKTILYDALLVEENSPSGEYIFQLDYDISFTAQVTYDDYTFSSYDKEDDKYYFIEKATRQIEMQNTQTAEISLEAYFEDGEKPEDADVSINCTYTSIPNESDIAYEAENEMFTL
jgi:predicted RNA-binding protein Jag